MLFITSQSGFFQVNITSNADGILEKIEPVTLLNDLYGEKFQVVHLYLKIQINFLV